MKNVILIGLILISIASFGQGGSVWYFGGGNATGGNTNDAAGLDFTTVPPTALPGGQGQLISYEGSAVLSDDYGNIYFYTDGSTCFDETHVSMPNGTGLFGSSSSTQSAIIAPVPGSLVEFFVFTNKSLNIVTGVNYSGLSYSRVNMDLAGNGSVSCPLGDVVTGVKNIAMADTTNEKIAIVPHANGIDYWVVCQGSTWNNLTSFLVTSAGVSAVPIITTSPFMGGAMGELKASPQGDYLAAAQLVMQDPVLGWPAGVVLESELQILGFDNNTGMIVSANCVKLDSSSTGTLGFYGVEFSPSGDYLYANFQPTSELYQFDMNAVNIPASKINIGTGDQGSLQLGPDSKIYQADANGSTIDVINFPEVAGAGCSFVAGGQSIGTGICKTGLPNSPMASILNSVFSDYVVNDTSICLGQSVSIGNSTKPNHTYTWNPALGLNNSTIANPLATPPVTTTYYLLSEYRCDTILDSLTISVNSAISSPLIDTIGSICTNVNAILTATAQSGGTINWYSDAGLTTNVGLGTVLNLGNVTIPGEHIYYATETIGGCEGSAAIYTFWTSDCPAYPCATNLLTNGDFENYLSCPDDGFSISQDSAVTVTNWLNGIIEVASGSNLTPDYFNQNCAYSNTNNYSAPYPSPNGQGYAGFISTVPFGGLEKEMLGMMYNLEKCQEYTFQIKIVQAITVLFSAPLTTDIVIYGGNSGGLPLLSATSCPIDEGFEVLATIPAGSIDSTWQTYNLTFTPSADYDCFIIGADCSIPSTGLDAILVDDVFLCVNQCINQASITNQVSTPENCGSNDGTANVDMNILCSTPLVFNWEDASSPGVNVSTDSIATGLTSGTYNVTVTDGNGCSSISSVVVTAVGGGGNPTIASADTDYCEGDLISNISVTNATGNYEWYSDNTLTNLIGSGTTVTPNNTTGTTTYFVTETPINCAPYDSVNITIHVAPVAGNDVSASFCTTDPGSDIFNLLTGATDSNGSWLPNLISGNNFFNPSADTPGSYYYIVSGTQFCDADSAQVIIAIEELPNAGNDGSIVACSEGGIVDLFNSLGSSPDNGGDWLPSMNSGSGVLNPLLDTSSTYIYIVNANGTCPPDTAIVSVLISTSPVVTITPTNDVCNSNVGSIISIVDGIPPYTYIWNTNDTDASLFNLAAGDYSLEVTNSFGCNEVVDVTVLNDEIDCDYHTYLPNVFSPNGDNENDVLYVRGKGIQSFTLIIYNRWGNKVFETTDINIGWDGSYRGIEQGNAVFVYYLTATFINGGKKEEQGNVSIVK